MNWHLPRLPFLRRRSSPVFTAFCDGAIFLALVALILPSWPWAWFLAALAATAPGWLNRVRARRTARRVFVPDPLAPDFAALASALVASAEAAALEGNSRLEWTLCPYCDANGAAIPYSIDLLPARGEISVGTAETRKSAKAGMLLRPRLPVPIAVRDEPVTFSLAPAKARRQIFVDAPRPVRLLWNRAEGNWIRDDVAKLWPALAMALLAAFPDSPLLRPERLALLSLLLVLATLQCARGGNARAK